MGCPAQPGANLFCSVSHPSRTGFFMSISNSPVLKLAQVHASDVIKRRWPGRYIAKPVVNVKDCVKGLVEIGAISEETVQSVGKSIALIHWMLSRIEVTGTKLQKNDTSFYRSSAWRKLRFTVLAQSDCRCAACGAKSKDGATLHVDHIKPRSKFPEFALDPENLQVLCDACNIGKGDGEAITF